MSEDLPDQAWLDALLSDSREVVVRLLEEPPLPVAELRRQVVAHLEHVRQAAGFAADLELAEDLGSAALALLDRVLHATPHDVHRAQVAVRYFVLDEDGDDDLGTVFGFDDDVEVFNAVAESLGLPDLVIGELRGA